MNSGGKRKSVDVPSKNCEEIAVNMSPERKRSKLENNNTYKDEDEFAVMYVRHLDEMGVRELPTSDTEESSEGEGVNYFSSNPLTATDKSDESSLDSLVHKSPVTAQDTTLSEITPLSQTKSFRLGRLVQNRITRPKLDLFGMLSDEMVLMILQWLPKRTLCDCALVCQRWRRIVYDESLWQRIDLTLKSLKPDHMAYVLQRNPVILRMAQAEVVEPIFQELGPDMAVLQYNLQYLDLSMALIKPPDLAQLLSMFTQLRKLSLEHCSANTDVCTSIAYNSDLEVLNLSQCYDLEWSGLEEILINCSDLVELNLAWTRLDSKCVDYVCKLVNPSLQRLNLSGCLSCIKDSNVLELVMRCADLRELDLSDCTDITASSIDYIIKHLGDIQELSFSRCYSIPPNKYVKLQASKSLQCLNIFGLMTPPQVESLCKVMKSVQVNKQKFSTNARPTVGIRRTSVWGLRTRD